MADSKTPISVLVNPDTGEIYDTYYAGDRISITRSEQMQYANTHIMKFNSGKSFVKIYDEVVPMLEHYLTLPEFKFAICLIPHVSYEDCIIRKTQDRGSKILSMKEIAEIHALKYDYVRKIMASLKNKGIIGKHETGSILSNYAGENNVVYTVNPYIYFRGSDIILPIHSFYENSGWKEMLCSTGKNVNEQKII